MLASNEQAFKSGPRAGMSRIFVDNLSSIDAILQDPIQVFLLEHRAESAGSLPRLPAQDLENLVTDKVLEALTADVRTRVVAATLGDRSDRRQLLRNAIKRVEVSKSVIRVQIDPAGDGWSSDRPDDTADVALGPVTIEIPCNLIKRGGAFGYQKVQHLL